MLALRNLLTNDKLELGPDMVEAGLPKVVQQRLTQVPLLCSLNTSTCTLCDSNWLVLNGNLGDCCFVMKFVVVLTASPYTQSSTAVQHELVSWT